jgi:DNA-binding winged helix-turn-helix (wHTH) protein
MPPGPQQIYEFGPFRVDGRERTLLRDGSPIALTDKVFELLWLLVQNRGHALAKAELMQALWPDTVVEENNLTVNMSTLRKALGESAGQRRYIETLSRRGYRFVADVRESTLGALPLGALPLGTLPPIVRHTPTFVGRESEVARLAALLERARAGQGRVVLIDGDPGMGKTELAEQFLALARRSGQLIIAHGRCLEQFGTGEAYLPFLEASRSLLLGDERERVVPIFRQHAPTWSAQFGSAQFGSAQFGSAQFGPAQLAPAPSGLADGVEGLRGAPQSPASPRMLREMGDALEALSAFEPVVLLLEDMHWADPSSSDLLRLLGQRAVARRLLILATLRRTEMQLANHPLENVRRELYAHDQCEELELPLLDRAAIGRYIDARFQPHALPAELAELVVSKTEGHPLFATRLIQMLVERGDIEQVNGAWRLPRPLAELALGVPSSVRGLIQKKLDSLDEDDRRALQYASVLGVEFTTSALAHLLEVDEVSVDERLDPLARAHHLLEPLGEERLPNAQLSLRYRFAHVLHQNVLYETLASRRRMVLHQRAAEHLLAQQGGDAWRVAAQLAVHFEAARDYGRAIQQLIAAGDNASRLLANRESSQHYARALELVHELPAADQAAQNLILYYNNGWLAFKQGEAARAISGFEAMLELARSPELAADTPAASRARDAAFDYFEQPWRDAFGLFDVPRLQNQSRSMGAAALQCEAYWALSYILLEVGRLDEMAQRTAECLALAVATGNEQRRLEALAWLTTRELALGDSEQAKRYLNEGMPAARAIRHERALYLFLDASARLHLLESDYELAERMHAEALPLTLEVSGRVGGLLGIGLARAHLGRVSAALAPLSQALDIAQRTGMAESVQMITGVLGWVHAEVGDFASAAHHFAAASDLATASGRADTEAALRFQLARAHGALGDGPLAQGAIARAERLLEAPPAARGALATPSRRRLQLDAAQGEWRIASGELQSAETVAQRLLERALELRSPKHVAIARLLLAHAALGLARPDSAKQHAAAGLDALERHPIPLVAWKLHAALAAALRQTGAGSAATSELSRALELVEQIERSIDDERLRERWSGSRSVRELRAAAAPAGVRAAV